jgi:hypothetical protein
VLRRDTLKFQFQDEVVAVAVGGAGVFVGPPGVTVALGLRVGVAVTIRAGTISF